MYLYQFGVSNLYYAKEVQPLNAIDRLLHGSIDMHVHYGPHTGKEARFDALLGAQMASEAGMRAIVLKNHEYQTATIAYIVNQVVGNIRVIGGLCLNSEAGGLNPNIVETSAKLGAKMVWMPTISSNYQIQDKTNRASGIGILDGCGKLLPVVGEILDIAKRYELVVATGHVSVNAALVLADEARNRGIWRLVATHPLGMEPEEYFSLEDQRKIADKGAFVEHCFFLAMPEFRRDPKLMVEAIRVVGAEHCILSTDLGQVYNPAPAEGMRMMIGYMLKYGLNEKEIELMVKTNPAKLLGLD
jgi:Family of unknown function (DUF6282)